MGVSEFIWFRDSKYLVMSSLVLADNDGPNAYQNDHSTKSKTHMSDVPLNNEPVLQNAAESGDRPRSLSADSDRSTDSSSPLHATNTSSTSLTAGRSTSLKKPASPRGPGLKIIIACSITIAILLTLALILDIVLGNSDLVTHGAVASDVKECSIIGADILKKGGHAVDAAISIGLCLGIVHAETSGIGGGGFMLIRDKKEFSAIDFRETAPAAATEEMYVNNKDAAILGGLAVAVPGELKGYEAAWKKFGKLKWKSLFEPAVNLAKTGFHVTGYTANKIDQGVLDKMPEGMRNIYAPNDKAVVEGDVIHRPDLAKVLEFVAKEGADAFYTGDIGEEIVKNIKETKGIMTMADLQNYSPKVVKPIQMTFKNVSGGATYELHTLPAPSGGPVLFSIINILEKYYFNYANKDETLTYHRIIEAFKYAYAQKSQLGDPDFAEDVDRITEVMLNKTAADELRRMINDSSTYDPEHYGPFVDTTSHGTSHVSIIDQYDNMVSLTLTINELFGSYVFTNNSGILLNNEMDDFNWINKQKSDLPKSVSNYITSGKRPQSSMAPLIVLKKDSPCGLRFATGGAGGSKITTGIANIFFNLMSFGMSMEESIKRSRVHHPLIPNQVDIEDVEESIIEGLIERGHNVTQKTPMNNHMTGVMKREDHMTAASDPRVTGSGSIVF